MLARFFLLFLSVSVFFGNMSEALSRGAGTNVGGGYEDVFMPKISADSVIIDNDDMPPVGPSLAKTKFFRYPPVSSIGERVERLVYGIKMDVKPELDHYGYEIRRYMTHVGDIKIFSSNEFLNEQVVNIKKSRIIADYWRKHLEKEISEIEEIIDGNDSTELRVHSAFKQNKIATKTFLIILKSWINANERILDAIKEEPGIYEVIYPEVKIVVPTSRVNFFNLYSKRQAKLKDLRKYQPFAMMVY